MNFRGVVSAILAISLVQAQAQVPGYIPFTIPGDLKEAKVTIQAAEKRPMSDFNSSDADREFWILVQANAITKLVDDSQGFWNYFLKNRSRLVITAQDEIAMNWQLFLARSYMEFKIDSTNAAKNPSAFMAWLHSVADNEWVGWASWQTWGMIIGAILFVKGVVYGAMVAGPAASAIMAFLNNLLVPLNQKLTIVGNKYLGPMGMRLNSWLFDGNSNESELKSAHEAIDGLRAMMEGRHYEISPKQWQHNQKALFKIWNRLNFLFGLVPEAYRSGRDRFADLAILRQTSFATGLASSINAAEVHRQGAENIFNRIIAKGADIYEVERVSQNLFEVIGHEMNTDREAPDKVVEIESAIENAKTELKTLGGSAVQVDRIVENYRNVFVFRRQAATVLAARLIHDAMFSDTIVGVRDIYDQMTKNMSIQHFSGTLKQEIVDVLDKLQFSIEAKQSVTRIEAVAARNAVQEKVTDINEGRNAVLKTLSDTAAAPARAAGEIGHAADPTDFKIQVETARRKAGKR